MCFTKDTYKLKTLQVELPLTGAVTAMPNRRNRQLNKLKQIKHFMAFSFAAGKNNNNNNVDEIFEKINSHDIKTYSFIVDFGPKTFSTVCQCQSASGLYSYCCLILIFPL